MLIGESIAARDASGALVPASVSLGDSSATTTGMVHPARRGQGLGTWLCSGRATGPGTRRCGVGAQTLTEPAECLYARFGLAAVFAENVMRHDLSDVPDVPAPEGITLTPVSASDPVRMGRTVKR
jgi:mycothiol synthase